jgi:hypothetical protein
VKWKEIIAALKSLAPYAAIEFLLPGGSLIALALWFFRRRARVISPAVGIICSR